jgi:hypothetical protein
MLVQFINWTIILTDKRGSEAQDWNVCHGKRLAKN